MFKIVLALTFSTAFLVKDYSNSPNHSWFERQHSNSGMPCCEVADGQRVDDADWKSDSDGHYYVRLPKLNCPDDWCKVPDDALINPKDRPIDYAVVWVYRDRIMCFLVGSGI